MMVPAFLLSESFFAGIKWLSIQVQKDAIHIPPPPAQVSEWPLIGSWVYDTWTHASTDLDQTLTRFGPQLKGSGVWLLGTLTGLGFVFLMTIVSVIIAGVMLMRAADGGKTARSIGARLSGEQGVGAVDLATRTIRSVAAG